MATVLAAHHHDRHVVRRPAASEGVGRRDDRRSDGTGRLPWLAPRGWQRV